MPSQSKIIKTYNRSILKHWGYPSSPWWKILHDLYVLMMMQIFKVNAFKKQIWYNQKKRDQYTFFLWYCDFIYIISGTEKVWTVVTNVFQKAFTIVCFLVKHYKFWFHLTEPQGVSNPGNGSPEMHRSTVPRNGQISITQYPTESV